MLHVHRRWLAGDRRYFNRKLLLTTVTLESAIAAHASIGESSPNAAIGAE